MIALRIACVLPVLLAIRGARIHRGPQALTGSNEHPAEPSCFLAGGFDLERGCQYPQAMEVVPHCGPSNSDQACFGVDNSESVVGYMRDVRSSSDYSNLVNSVTEGEAGGFGQSMSASFKYMKRSQVSEKSLAFFIGASGKTELRSIVNTVALKLTPAAKELLQQDAREFVSRYGLRYIHSMSLGGSFLGSVTLNSIETADDQDVQAFASFSVNYGLFSASGSSDFQNTRSQHNFDVSVLIDAGWSGGSNITQNYSTPEALHEMFQAWDSSWRANPTALTVTTRRWIDSHDVQAIVNSLPAEEKELFNVPDITRGIREQISEENAEVTLIDTSVSLALQWIEVQDDQAVLSCLESLSLDVSTQLMRIELLDEPTVITIQQQWLAGDYSWFMASSLHDRYSDCVKDVTPNPVTTPVPTPTPAPTPPNPTPAPTPYRCRPFCGPGGCDSHVCAGCDWCFPR